ncbi:MAG: toprim domain-containing protein [Burkholderiales bacterium]|nr:toprim domain-containing protein [Burkholderiales bacterium]
MYRFPTNSRRNDTAGWCKLFADLRGGVFGCYRLGISETWSTADKATMTRAERAELARQVLVATAEREAHQRQQWAANAARNARLWAEGRPLVPGDPVTLHLKRRGFGGLWPLPVCLRIHRGLPYWHEGVALGTYPAMLAPLVAPDGRTVAVHRTYLAADGRKAEVPTVRKLTGAAGPLAGACIPLFRSAHGCIGIAEGIETALAAWCASGVPTVASYSAGNLAAWQWPAGVQRLVIFADYDLAGTDAADKLQGRALRAGLQVSVMTPTEPGADWCDVWAGGAAMLTEGCAA